MPPERMAARAHGLLLLPPGLTSRMATLGLIQQMASLGLVGGGSRLCLEGPRWPDMYQMRSRMLFITQLSPWGARGP